MTILIVEGCDLSGKTTAIEKIAKKLNNGFILKNTYKPRSANDEQIYKQYNDISKLVSLQDKPDYYIILDRFYPSQAVYSVLRGEDEMNSYAIKTIDVRSAMADFKYIYLNTSLKTLEERYKVRGDDYLKIEQLKLIKSRYDEFYDLTQLNKIKIDTLQPNWLDDVISFVGKQK